jgi:hypothetical protein
MDHGSATTIIYDDDEIRVMWSPGSSDFVLLTFGDLVNLARDQRFFADVPVKKSEIATIGVMAKRANWYPSDSVHKASGVILDKVSGYETRVTYGGSMGGYAAVKFSRLLGASHVISLCPQWSIDPAECQGTGPGWDYFIPTMSGMGIRPGDVAGEVFVFSDAFEKLDMFHCQMIIENYPGTHFINVPHVEHGVTMVFAGTVNLLELIDACRACDITALRRISRRTRKSHWIWQRWMLSYAIRKLPRVGIHFLSHPDRRDLLRENWRYFPHILSHLASTVGAGRAIAFYEGFWSLLPGPVEQQMVCAYLVGVTGGRIGITTKHVSWLIYDLSENKVLHTGASPNPWEIQVEAELLDTAAALFVTVGGTRFRLSVNDKGWLDVPAIKGRGEFGFLFQIRPDEDGQFAISQGGQYLCAEPGGEVICNRNKVADWERFRFGPLPR